MKALLREWDHNHPGRVQNIFNSLSRVTCSHLLDRGLFEFENLAVSDANNARALSESDSVFEVEVGVQG